MDSSGARAYSWEAGEDPGNGRRTICGVASVKGELVTEVGPKTTVERHGIYRGFCFYVWYKWGRSAIWGGWRCELSTYFAVTWLYLIQISHSWGPQRKTGPSWEPRQGVLGIMGAYRVESDLIAKEGSVKLSDMMRGVATTKYFSNR